MDELVKLVTQKTGLPEAQARQAVEVVLNYIKDKLPDSFGAQIDALIGGSALPGMDGLDGLAGGLGGLLKK